MTKGRVVVKVNVLKSKSRILKKVGWDIFYITVTTIYIFLKSKDMSIIVILLKKSIYVSLSIPSVHT